MSPEREPSWDSLPPHLKTSKLAYAICPQGAEDAADDLRERLFMGALKFNMLSRAELGAYLWRRFGNQIQAMSDAGLLAWIKHMGFREHDAFEGMQDAEVVRLLRRNEELIARQIARYPRSDDFKATIDSPSADPDELVQQIRKLFREDQIFNFVLVAALEHPEKSPAQ